MCPSLNHLSSFFLNISIYLHQQIVKADNLYNIIRIGREDTKITAWESIQKAKAEAAIQKLMVCSLFYFKLCCAIFN
jgi:hypothetical protein